MDNKRKIQATIGILGKPKLSEVLGWFGYFDEPTEELVWLAIEQKGEPFINALSNAAKQSVSHVEGTTTTTATTTTPTTTTPATTDTSSNVQGWITSAFGWLKTGSDIGLDWAKLYKENPGAKVDSNGNLIDANGNLLALAATNNSNTQKSNTMLYVAIAIVVIVVLAVVFLRKK